MGERLCQGAGPTVFSSMETLAMHQIVYFY